MASSLQPGLTHLRVGAFGKLFGGLPRFLFSPGLSSSSSLSRFLVEEVVTSSRSTSYSSSAGEKKSSKNRFLFEKKRKTKDHLTGSRCLGHFFFRIESVLDALVGHFILSFSSLTKTGNGLQDDESSLYCLSSWLS